MSKLEQKGEQQKSFMQISSLNPLILLSSLRSTRRKPACVAELRKRRIMHKKETREIAKCNKMRSCAHQKFLISGEERESTFENFITKYSCRKQIAQRNRKRDHRTRNWTQIMNLEHETGDKEDQRENKSLAVSKHTRVTNTCKNNHAQEREIRQITKCNKMRVRVHQKFRSQEKRARRLRTS